MQCKSCGAQLKVKDGLYFCEHCGSKFGISMGYDKNDVFIAYMENDDQGRRTKDSIIGQEVYNKLKSLKINTFYQRVSASNIFDTEYELICNAALDNSRIVIILGTNTQYFLQILEKYKKHFDNKILIPFYSDMNAYDIPRALNGLQALNYDSVGSLSDLSKNLLTLLGRADEINIVDEVDKKYNKRTKVNLCSVLGVLSIIVALCTYIVFGTPYVLPSKKYIHSQKLIEQGKYTEAIRILGSIENYKNSSDEINKIYSKYSGYYKNEENGIGLHINFLKNSILVIEIEKNSDGKITKASDKIELNGTEINMHFIDSNNNQGEALIVLKDDCITLKTTSDTLSANNAIGNNDISFKLRDKSDKPILAELTLTKLKEWLTNGVTESQIKSEGYELEFIRNLYRINEEAIYRIKNTNVLLLLIAYDFKNENYDTIDDRLLEAISAPIDVVFENKNNDINKAFSDGTFVYFPKCSFEGQAVYLTPYLDPDGNDLESNNVLFTSKNIFNEDQWKHLLNEILQYNYVGNPLTAITQDESASSNEYLFPSDSMYITTSELAGKSAEQVALIRNEIFARHGYIFSTEPYITYFNQKSWYVPNSSFDSSSLNSIEKANVDFITQYEKEQGYK